MELFIIALANCHLKKDKIIENARVFVDAILKAKPQAAKGVHI